MEGNPDVVMFGLMSSMRTGNMILDMCVCLVLPVLFRHLYAQMIVLMSTISAKLRLMCNTRYRRTIVLSYSSRPWADPDNKAAHKNGILQAAIREYVGRKIVPAYNTGQVKLTAVQSKSTTERGSAVDQLEKLYSPIVLPPTELPAEVAPGLFYTDSSAVQQNEGDGKGKQTTTRTVSTITFEASRFGGKQLVDKFVQEAYEWYVKEVASREDNSRFMYQPLVRDKFSSKEERAKPRQYKRYALSGEKTFNSLFFPDKARLLKVLGNFTDKKGKFAVPGFPHKLGLLLYGPPGTGKTSLVKAIAEHTKRHIISVPLSRIHTNQELMDVMFDQCFNYLSAGKSGDGDDEQTKNGIANKHLFSDVIFLLEDVDAATDIVLSREARQPKPSTHARTLNHELHLKFAALASKLEEVEAIKKKAKSKDDDEEDDKAGGDEAPGGDDPLASKKRNKGGDSKDDDEKKKKDLWEKDKLSLAGVLNVLDGVVDAPGRILIMTTNHPEKLDAALIRPGRVNLQLFMGFCQTDAVVSMTRHYYPGVSDGDLENVRRTFQARLDEGLKLSPAEMEQLCAESNTPADLVRALNRHAV